MQKSGTDVGSLLQLIFSALFGLLALAGAALLGISGGAAALQGSVPTEQATPVFSLMWSTLMVSVFLFISAGWSLAALLGHRPDGSAWKGRYLLASLLLLVWPLLVLLTGQVAKSRLAWLLVPPLLLAGVAIPIWWYLETGRNRLPVGHPQRTWGLVAVSTVITVPLILVAELLSIVGALSGVGIWLSQRPELAAPLTSLLDSLRGMQQIDPAMIQRWLAPLLTSPAFIIGALFVIAVIAPFIEELFKPLAVWLLAGRGMTPAQGFWAGMVCGAIFALLETLGTVGGAAGVDVATILLARLGTGLLHITTAGLSGWAIAATWRDGHYRRIAGIFLLAVLMHGLWNLFGLTLGFSPLLDPSAPSLPEIPLIRILSRLAIPALLALIVVNLGILISMNRRLRRIEPAQGLQPQELLP